MQNSDDLGTIDLLRQKSKDASKLLGLISNEKRLLILCGLFQSGEMSVTLAKSVDLGQSALSQHLALMREAKIVSYRREAQQLLYFISDEKILKLLESLRIILCS